VSAGRVASLRIETAAIVLHDEVSGRRAEAQRNVDPLRAGVLQRIGERLETDAQQVMFV
jgi:hypothetical protein